MRARASRYTPDLTAYLDAHAARAHATLYGAEPIRLPAIASCFTRDFPRALRENGRFFAIACALFFLPFFGGLAGALASDEFATRVLPSSVLQGMASMYSEGLHGRDG